MLLFLVQGLSLKRRVPRISRSKFVMAEGWVDAKSKMDAFTISAMACVSRFVFPVLENYPTDGFMV